MDRVDQAKQKGSPASWLDRPLWGRVTGWHVAYVAIIAFILFTRLWDLSSRAYSHDESIHAWESWKLITGQGYEHSPVYHGPFLYHFTALIFGLFGHNDYTARLSPAIAGIVITILPLFLQRWLGKRGVLMATLLMAISPVVMARSRFLRHDQYAIAFNLILLIAMLNYLETRKPKHLYWFAAAMALGLTAKETSFITYAIFGTFMFLYYVHQLLSKERHTLWNLPVVDLMVVMVTLLLPFAAAFPIKLLGHDPIDYSNSGLVFSGIITGVLLLISVALGALWGGRRWFISAGIFWAIILTLFTTLFTNGQGIGTGIVGQLGYWLSQQGVQRGGQPWYYYLALFPLYEFLPIALGVYGVIHYVGRRLPCAQPARKGFASTEDAPAPEVEADLPAMEEADVAAADDTVAVPQVYDRVSLLPLLIYWSLLAVIMYSWAGEKMPWLMLHLAVPLQLFAGWALAELVGADWREITRKGGLWLFLLVPAFGLAVGRLFTDTPTTDTSLAGLSLSLGWFTAFIVALVLVGLLWRVASRLNWSQAWRTIGCAVVAVLMALTVRFAWMATFIHPDSASEFLVYAQAAPDVAQANQEIRELSYRITGGLHLKVAYDDESSWPWVWYLRDFDQAQFYGESVDQPFDADVVIVGPGNEAAILPFLGNNYYRREYRLIWWPNQDWYISWQNGGLRTKLADPVERAKLWKAIFYREYDASLDDWPFVHDFVMYVRRDIVDEVWDYGPESLSALGSLPGDDYLEKWSTREADLIIAGMGDAPGSLLAPKGIALDGDGNLYVADSGHNRIQVYDANGQFLRQWGYDGTAAGQFTEPWGVAVSPDGQEVYVADTWNHRIQVFTNTGAFLRQWGQFGEAANPQGPDSVLYGPRAVACDQDGNVWVADTGNKRVIKFDPNGVVLGAVGGDGMDDGQLKEPVGIVLDADGNLYVVDTWNQRVQVFGADMQWRRSLPIYAWTGTSVVNKPYVAVSAEGHILITDPESYRVIEFDNEGNVVASWGQYGTGSSAMDLPTGIAVDAAGRIYVSDSQNNRVLRFDP